MKIVGIIPARYGSTRFPGKPLAMLAGKTLLQRVYERAARCVQIQQVAIATDHPAIAEHAQSLGARVCMTSSQCQSGTDRCYEALRLLDESFDYVINIQGDEPLIAPEQIAELAQTLDGNVELATLIKKIDDQETLFSKDEVKVVVNKRQEAIYFSRSAIPHLAGKPVEKWASEFTYFKHVGLYAYRSDALAHIAGMPPSALEQAESLEQLRWIENGYPIRVAETRYESYAVETPEDLQRIEKLIEASPSMHRL